MPVPQLPGNIQPAAAGLSGFDIDSVLSANAAREFINAGNSFCLRYIPCVPNLTAGCPTNAEALVILNAGLALMPVQHATPPGKNGWTPTAELGTTYGTYTATWATDEVGLPPGVIIWNDLEGVNLNTTADVVIAYCQAWYIAGYVPGIYLGYDVILTSEQLYEDLSYKHCWKAYNRDPGVATRGYQLLQTERKVGDPEDIDHDTTQTDQLGGNAIWLAV